MRKFLTEIYAIWISERPALLAAALAYYGMFSFAPVIYIAFYIAGFFIDHIAAANQMYLQIENVLGLEAAEQVRSLVEGLANTNRGSSFLISLVSFLALYFAASGLFFQIEYALNRVWRAPIPSRGHTRVLLKKRIISFIMVIGVSLLLIAAVLINVIISWFGNLIERFFSIADWHLILTWVASFGLITISFALLYKLLPEVRLRWRDVWPGSMIAALLVMLASMLAALYFKGGSFGSAFQAAGAFAVLLLAIYYTAQIFLMGAVITRVYATHYGSRVGIQEEPVL